MIRIFNAKTGKIFEREETAEEKEIRKKLQEESAKNPPVPTPEERLTKLESENAELRQALEILLGKETAVK